MWNHYFLVGEQIEDNIIIYEWIIFARILVLLNFEKHINRKINIVYMKLYKYKALPYKKTTLSKVEKKQKEYCEDIMVNNRLFMAPRNLLNDPLEGMAIPIELGVCGDGSYGALGLVNPFIEMRMDQYKILSLSANSKSPIMWAHYANNYCGVCFEFELNCELYNIHKVSYIKHQYDTIYDPEEKEICSAIETSLLCKSESWSYEEEYRIISKGKESYVYFSKPELTGIIVGHRALELVYVQNLINLAKKNNIPVYYTFISTRDYEINIINKIPTDLRIGMDTLSNIS